MKKQKPSVNDYFVIESRWKSVTNYRLILLAWMMNETATVFSPSEISHNGFYVLTMLHVVAVIFIGLPLVYSEICIGQYTNCNAISMWNFFPLFRSVGYATLLLIVLKTIYIMVLTSWYLDYSFHAALDPPPWSSCNDFYTKTCIVKKINASAFQHCIETQILFNDNCGMKTASNYFFENKIGNNNTKLAPSVCFYKWNGIILSCIVGLFLFLSSLRRDKFVKIILKLIVTYVCVSMFILTCVALSTNGTWYATNSAINWSNFTFKICFISIIRGFLSVGTGYGIITFISRDCPFRSPATMISISTPLVSLFSVIIMALISFNGIKTMSYYHREEENVLEIGASGYFTNFASLSEIMIYFDRPFCGFLWFSSILLCLFTNLWILFIYLEELSQEINIAYRYKNISNFIIIALICVFSWPFFCSDLTGVLTDSTELMQLTNSCLFSLSLYWLYGIKNHNNDITFMIGIKASYYWKICWVFKPIIILAMIYFKRYDIDTIEYDDSFYIKSLSMNLDTLLFFIFIGIYNFMIILGVFIHTISYYRSGELKNILSPESDWGPKDSILFKSRKMFVPEIMTREFLYRQVRIHGYMQRRREGKRNKSEQKILTNTDFEWSALTSN